MFLVVVFRVTGTVATSIYLVTDPALPLFQKILSALFVTALCCRSILGDRCSG